MSEPQTPWTAVDRYFADLLLPADEALAAALHTSAAASLPPIQVSPTQGRLLTLLARALGARRILEIGTLGGYSAIWLARGLPPDGTLITLELDPRHAEVARRNLARAGLAAVADVRVGPALGSLARLAADSPEPFDLVFIDADKERYPECLDAAIGLTRPGGLIIIDNVVRDGRILESGSRDAAIQGTRRMLEQLARDPRVDATAIQTVGEKGYDGFAIATVRTAT